MTPSRPFPRLLCLLPLAGCFIATPMRPDDGPDDSSATEIVPSEDDADTGAYADTRWGVSGTLVIAGDQPDPAASRLKLETRGVACSVAATLQSSTGLAAPPRDIEAGWTLEVVAEPGNACTWRGPTTLVLAVGEADPQLRPAADRAGLPWEGTSGMYLGTHASQLFLVGLARPLATDTADTDASSRAYELTTLHGLPLQP